MANRHPQQWHFSQSAGPMAISLIGVICAIVTSFAYWNRKLTNEVQQRKAIEEKLTYLTNNVDGILMQHTQHSQDPEDISVQFISENIHQFTGFSADEFKENPQRLIELLRQRSDHKRLFSEFYRAVEHGYWQTELQLQSPAGQQRWLEIRSQVVQIDNGWQWTSILIDITIMKQQQLELERARREAETAAQAKSRFLAMMSHEIRTPISGILSMLELLEPHIRHDLHARGLHNHLDLSAKNLLNIVNDVLDFSKIEAGKLTLSPAPCSIADLVSELIQPHAIYAQQKGLGFRLWLAPNIADQLHCDPLRLRQVLNNLLNNAAKFTEQGEIAVSVNVIEETPQQQTLQISVSDSGIGISEDDLGKLFQPFEQADASSERRFSGTGLGLSICRQLVHLMGGDITAFSTLGEGSIFRFSLPAKRIALQQQLSMDLRCGLFDIEKDSTSLLVQYLSYWHCDVVELNDDSPSWATISDGLYDVVLMPQRWQAKIEAIETKLKLPPKVIYLADSPLLSAEPCHQGWVIGNFPLVPQQLLQALANVPSAPCLQPSSLQQPSLQQLGTMPMASTCIDRETAMAQKRLLLVAEDHPINQQIIRQQLQALGFYADIVSNGLEALQALHSQQYALLISDCHMPELDGYGLVKAIRQQQATPLASNTQHFYLPVIALTANTAADAKAHIEHYQFDDFLTKPVSLDTLSEKLSDWLVLSPHHSDSDTEQTVFTVGTQQDNPEIKRHAGPINIDTITTMFGDLETCTHFIKQYMNSCVDDLEALSTAIHSQNSDTILLISHRMKGAARMMEYQEMAEQCELIEKQSICSKVNMISIEPIHAMLDDLRRQVRQLS
ncbi:ATP-binding protein [Photobacterium satsumensis]|uniref:ATP-binding protein n=1 Tax=Photobacterium satsumensis TaxID=2910239 RepID=UPI003D0B2F66